jgi:hypothetical protein
VIEMRNTKINSPLTLRITEGAAYLMGDGIVVMRQRDETVKRGKLQEVVATRSDLEALSRADNRTLTIPMEDGEAHFMGDGLFILRQHDDTRKDRPLQNVVVTSQDLEVMLAAA